MRPSMLPTGLECLSYNINRKNNNLLFLEFGKTYATNGAGYQETENLALYFTGTRNDLNWHAASKKVDIYFVKGICSAIFALMGLENVTFNVTKNKLFAESTAVSVNGTEIAVAGNVSKSQLEIFSIKQPVFFVCINWQKAISLTSAKDISFEPIAKFPQVNRDLSMVVDQKTTYQSVEDLVHSLHLKKLTGVKLFDVFENEKLGASKKSFAVSFTFLDKEKTLTDKEVDGMMNKIIELLETSLHAEIRRNA
jgi:phenylalanyl-tRNA synthetase beta chain